MGKKAPKVWPWLLSTLRNVLITQISSQKRNNLIMMTMTRMILKPKKMLMESNKKIINTLRKGQIKRKKMMG